MKKLRERISNMDARSMLIFTFILFIASCILRSILADFPKSINIRPDEIRFLDISISLFNGDGIIVHNMGLNFDWILYPLFLAPFNLIEDPVLRISAISIGNSILISSVLFPAFLLGKRLIKDNTVVLLLLATVFILPDMTTSMTFMSENLFYPLAAWLIYFVFMFWDCKESRKKYIYLILSAVFCFLAFLTKLVAVYFIFAFAAALVFDCLFTKSNSVKQNMKYLVLFITAALGLILIYKVSILLLWGSGAAMYGHNFNFNFSEISAIIYYIYAFAFNMMFALIAFFYFPVVFPILRFRHLGKSEKNMLMFAVTALVTMVAIITVSISINEDYPDIFMRQHTRYYAPLLIFFLAIFYKQCFAPREEALGIAKPKTAIVVSTVSFSLVVLFIFRFFDSVCIDGVLLQAIASLEDLAESSGDINEFSVLWQRAALKVFLVLYVVVLTVFLFKKETRKKCAFMITGIIVAVCILNSVVATIQFRDIYSKDEDTIEQAISINEYIAENADGKNVLVITDGYDYVLDTYITEYTYWTKKEKLEDVLGELEYIDFETQEIICIYPSVEYEDLDSVDYIITDNTVTLDPEYYEEIEITGLTEFSVYKALDPTKIYVEAN